MNPTSPVNPRSLLPLLAALLLLLAAGPLAPADAASASVQITPTVTVSMSFSTSVTATVSVTTTMSFSPSDTPSFSTSVSTSLTPSFSTSLTNSVSPSFSASVPNSMSATKSIGATPARTPPPNHVPGVASPGLPVTIAPTPGLGPKGSNIAMCGNGVKDRREQCEYRISDTKRNPCCTRQCRFRKPLHICGTAPTCYKPPRCGSAGVCDPPVQEVYRAACKTTDGRKGACIKGVCNPSITPRSKKMLQRMLERRLRKMRNLDLAARGLPQQEQEEYEGDEELSAEEEFLADLNNSTDWQ